MNEFFNMFNYMRPYLLPADETASALYPDGTPKKKNFAIFLHECSPIPNIVKIVNNIYFHQFGVSMQQNVSSDSLYSLYPRTNWDSHLLSYYNEDKSGYDYHTDSSLITMIMWFNNGEKNYTGGELHFPDYDMTVNCDHNTGIIFPGHVNHGVKPLKIIDKNKDIGRISYTVFTGIRHNQISSVN